MRLAGEMKLVGAIRLARAMKLAGVKKLVVAIKVFFLMKLAGVMKLVGATGLGSVDVVDSTIILKLMK